jgi:DNA-binding MarR family transcriptional regulator
MKKKYTKQELEEMKDESDWNEFQTYLKSDEYIEEHKTQSGRVNQEIPDWLKNDIPQEEKDELQKKYYLDYLDLKNPYRKLSKVNLTMERKNYRWIESSVLKTLMSSGITGSEWSVLFYIIHRTRGYRLSKIMKLLYKPVEPIKIKEIQEWTELSTPNIYRTLKSLMKKRLIYQVGQTKDNYYTLGVNFRYDTWKV